jgi:hypothetical protein
LIILEQALLYGEEYLLINQKGLKKKGGGISFDQFMYLLKETRWFGETILAFFTIQSLTHHYGLE